MGTVVNRTQRHPAWWLRACALLAALVISSLGEVAPPGAAAGSSAGTPAPESGQVQTLLPDEVQRSVEAALRTGARRVGARLFLWPGANGVYDSVPAGAGEALTTGLAASPTDDFGMVIQATWSDCPNGWVCLYDWRDWNEDHPQASMWIFQEVTSNYQDLANFNAKNRAASWRNRRNHDSRLRRGTSGPTLCMDSKSNSARMSAAWRDNADYIRNFNSDGLC
jgi:hypothetical protein